jgi:hypothetical protein
MKSFAFLAYAFGGAVIAFALFLGISSRLDPRQQPILVETPAQEHLPIVGMLEPVPPEAPPMRPLRLNERVRNTQTAAPLAAAAVLDDVLVKDKLLDQLPEGYHYSSSVEFDGFTLKSVVGPSNANPYVTLDKAMLGGECVVKEGDGGICVASDCDSPIFCMAGDLLLGGHQDRILAENIVIKPRATVCVPVFCVEHGRSYADPRDGVYGQRGEFFKDERRSQADLAVKRAAIQTASQAEVWAEVAHCNESLGCGGVKSTGTFRNVYDDKKTADLIEQNLAVASELQRPNVVGYAVFAHRHLVGLDLFDSAGLCAKLSSKLLRGYIITGLAEGGCTRTGATRALPPGAEYAVDGESSNPAMLTSRENVIRVMDTTPTERTTNRREYRADCVRYSCTDSETGRRVHLSLTRR